MDDGSPGIAKLAGTPTSIGGQGAIITRIAFVSGLAECFIAAVSPGQPPQFWLVAYVDRPQDLLGSLVIIDAQERKLTRSGVATHEIREPNWPCPVCSEMVLRSALDLHLADRHDVARCPKCHNFITKSALREHLNHHGPDPPAHIDRVTPPPAREEAGTGADDTPADCPRGHGLLRHWEGTRRCWTCGWPFR